MATLICEQLSSQYRLELHPWSAEGERRDPDSYRLSLYKDDALVYDDVHSVAGWQEGHHAIYRISNAFRRSELLVGRTLRFNLYSNACPSKHPLESASLDVDADWLSFTLCAMTRARRSHTPGAEKIAGKASLRLRDGADAGTVHMLMFRFVCSPQQAIHFGEELAQAGRIAAQERTRTGYSTPDSYEPFTPETPNDTFVRGTSDALLARPTSRLKHPVKYSLI